MPWGVWAASPVGEEGFAPVLSPAQAVRAASGHVNVDFPDELVQMIKIIRQVHEDFKVAIFLIEHRMKFVMELCEYIQTLVFGEVIAEGPPEEIQNNPDVVEAYLGKEDVT